MKIISYIPFILFFIISCTINKYSYRNSDDDQLFGPLYPDYTFENKIDTSINTFTKNRIFKEYVRDDSSCYVFEYFWVNGCCLRSMVYCDSNIQIYGEKLHRFNQAGYQGKYLIEKDTLYTEYFIGGNPNSYFHKSYKLVDSTAIFIKIGERLPNRKRIIYRSWMQERYNKSLNSFDVDSTNLMLWDPKW